MRKEKGDGEVWGELGEMGWLGWRKGGYGSREINILTKRAILGFARDLTIEGFPGPRRGPRIVPWAAEERGPELALSHSHTDEYLAYHHRTFIWRWMKIETETHIGALDLAPKFQMGSIRRENMSKEVRATRGVRPPTETVGLI